ncbi:MAG: hypothetical protein WBL54_08290 [Nitrososphaeraceae archaeon]
MLHPLMFVDDPSAGTLPARSLRIYCSALPLGNPWTPALRSRYVNAGSSPNSFATSEVFLGSDVIQSKTPNLTPT